MNRTAKFLGSLIAVAILLFMIAHIFEMESKKSAVQYREAYREQGREQIRHAAIEAGVAEVVGGEFRWKTNELGDVLIQKEIYDTVIKALEYRRDNHAERSEDKSKEEAAGSSESQSKSKTEEDFKEASEELEGSEGSEGSQEEGKAAEAEVQD